MSKTYVLKCAAYNLGLLLRKVWGLSKPRNREEGVKALVFAILALLLLGTLQAYGITKHYPETLLGVWSVLVTLSVALYSRLRKHLVPENTHFLMGC